MPFAVVLFFDDDQAKPINDVIEELAVKKAAPFMFEESIAHVTLAIYDELDCGECRDKFIAFSHAHEPITFNFSHIGVFTPKRNAIMTAPVVTERLLRYHQDFHEFFSDTGIGSWKEYQPGNWIPHCTLGFNVTDDKLDAAFSISRKLKLPLQVASSSIGIMEFEPVSEVYRVSFSELDATGGDG